MNKPRMKKVKGAGATLQARVWEGKGEPVILIHGLTANLMCWDAMAGSLSPAHKVVAYDLRGRGLSEDPGAGYDIQAHVDDLAALMDRLKIGKANIVGHSLGASIALAFAAAFPERSSRLVLLDGAGKLTEAQVKRVFQGIKPSLERLDRVFPSESEFIKLMKAAPFFKTWTRAHHEYFRYDLEKVEGGVRSRVRRDRIMRESVNLVAFKPADLYKKVSCPTLILRAPEGMMGGRDALLPRNALKRMVGSIKRTWLVEIEGANHYSIIINPSKTRDRALAAFLSS